ncbi:MAG: hypothetical protein ACOC3A_10630 [Thermodesulfobacteriota bacterium]
MDKLITRLKEMAQTVRDIEASADAALKNGDKEGYTEKMREKARLLQVLPETLAPVTEDLPDTVREPVEDRLERFSASAANALRLDSVFFMWALLYPEDYREGEPNDLERFIADLEGSIKR